MKIFFFLIVALFLTTSVTFADETVFDQAMSLYRMGDYKGAIKHLQEYVEEKPDPYAYYLLGYAFYKIK
ncbi:MAG: hypothetical protein AB1390_09620, partial [Nitrospirota bacterium]